MADVVTYVDTGATGAGTGVDWANAYTSLAQWDAAEETDLTSDTDTHTVHFRCSTGVADSTAVSIDGWVTSADYDLTVYVAPEDRHDGTRGSGARLVASVPFSPAFYIQVDFFTVVGLAVCNTGTVQESSNIEVNNVNDGIRIIDSCLSYDAPGDGIRIHDWHSYTYIINCMVYSSGQYSVGGAGIRIASVGYVYNCVVCNSITGSGRNGYGIVQEGYRTVNAINCYSGGNDDEDYHVTYDVLNRTTCHSSDTTGNTQTAFSTSSGAYFTNVTSGSEDIHITSDSDLIDVGTDLHADTYYPFAVDAWDTARPNGSWDVGAHEFVGGAPTINHEAMMLGCNF